MIFLSPIFLLLALPLVASLWMWRFRSRWLLAFRVLTLSAIVLMLAGLSVRMSRQSATVVVVADRSLSLPIDSEVTQKDAIALLRESMHAEDRLAVVSFGRNVAVEHPPGRGEFAGFVHDIGRDASNLTEAIETGIALIPSGDPGRVVVLSDGQWTGRDPSAAATLAAERNIALDYRSIHRAAAKDTAIVRIDAPQSVQPGESFLITAWVLASAADEIGFELQRDGERLAAGKRKVEPGLNRFTFRDRAVEPGLQEYVLAIAPQGHDATIENNTGRFLIGIDGLKPLLVVTSSPKSGLPGLLQAGGLSVKAMSPEECRWTIEGLSKYSGVLLENVPAGKIGHVGMETLAAWVQHTGTGLMMTGGKAAYAPGGYYQSPLDPLLPVSMELRQEHRKLSVAMVVALDRSGSMAMAVGGGRVKMDLANLGAAQVVDLLGPMDEFGCIAVDSAPHIIKDLGKLDDKAAVRAKILRINSEGGGIFVYEALDAALQMIRKSKTGARHIILFSDAADAEEPKQYLNLLAKCRAEGITVSVIGLGRESDKDGALLKDIAAKGNGRIFFTDQPAELPRLFAQDTFVVARNTFLDQITPLRTTAGLSLIANKSFEPPDLGGYNLCYIRPKANLAAVTVDEYSAPVVASWQTGAGRVVCYTGEADGKYTGAIAKWKDVGDFYSSLARWTIGKTATLPDGSTLTQERKKGVVTITLSLDPNRADEPFAKIPEVKVLRSAVDKKPAIESYSLRWTGPDALAVDVPLFGAEAVQATLSHPTQGPIALPLVCLPYSPEYEPPVQKTTDANAGDPTFTRWGVPALEDLAQRTGGRERINLATLWSEMPRPSRLMPLTPWLLAAACLTLLLEVLERLTGIFSRSVRVVPKPIADAAPAKVLGRPAVRPQPVAPEPPPPASSPEAPQGGLLEALRQVQKKKR